jgi:DNA-directed RNA polymerase specialized sigma24 family protein
MPDIDQCKRALEQVKNGDTSAFALLYSRLAPSVKGFTHRLLGRFEYVDEITQDAFLALFHSINRIESAEYLLP